MELFDLIVKNGTIITMNSTNTLITGGVIGVNGDKITFIGDGDHSTVTAKEIIDADNGLILPGLINCHTHAAMTLFRGLADDLPLMEWLNDHIFPAERKIDADFVFTGTLLACAEMILSGTTTFCDMYLFEESVALACKEAGVRSLVGEVLYDFNSPNYGSPENGLKYTELLIEKWKADPIVSIAVEPHSLFTCSPALLISAHKLSVKKQVPLIIHLAETEGELRFVKDTYGKSPVEHLDALGILGPNLIACHCVHVSPEEIGLLKERGVKVVHNPESNMKLASGISPVREMISSGIKVGLGTDGCASNNDLDLFSEMDTAAKLQKIKSMDSTAMDALKVLKMATQDGACVLGMDKSIGSLEVGKKADIIIVDIMDKPHLTPMYNPYSQIVYSARGADVIHSIINGRIVMRNRQLLTIDLRKIIEKANLCAEKIKLKK